MSTTVFGRVGLDFARSAPYLVTTIKGTGFMDLRAVSDVEDCVRVCMANGVFVYKGRWPQCNMDDVMHSWGCLYRQGFVCYSEAVECVSI